MKIEINEYQRANLLELIKCCGFPALAGQGVDPFTAYNTGDWLGELYWLLDGNNPPHLAPNKTRDDLAKELGTFAEARREIAAWRALAEWERSGPCRVVGFDYTVGDARYCISADEYPPIVRNSPQACAVALAEALELIPVAKV